MAAVVQHAVVHEAVLALHPAAWVNRRDVAALVVGNGVGADARERLAAATLEIQLAELHKRAAGFVLRRESGHAAVDVDAQGARIRRDVGDSCTRGISGAVGLAVVLRLAGGGRVAASACAVGRGDARAAKARECQRKRKQQRSESRGDARFRGSGLVGVACVGVAGKAAVAARLRLAASKKACECVGAFGADAAVSETGRLIPGGQAFEAILIRAGRTSGVPGEVGVVRRLHEASFRGGCCVGREDCSQMRRAGIGRIDRANIMCA